MKPRKGLPKTAPQQKVRISSSGDNSMEEAEAWTQSGSGVDETVHDVGSMPNDRVMHDEDPNHLR